MAAVIVVLGALHSLCLVIPTFISKLGPILTKIGGGLFELARFSFALRYIFENFMQITVTFGLEMVSYF